MVLKRLRLEEIPQEHRAVAEALLKFSGSTEISSENAVEFFDNDQGGDLSGPDGLVDSFDYKKHVLGEAKPAFGYDQFLDLARYLKKQGWDLPEVAVLNPQSTDPFELMTADRILPIRSLPERWQPMAQALLAAGGEFPTLNLLYAGPLTYLTPALAHDLFNAFPVPLKNGDQEIQVTDAYDFDFLPNDHYGFKKEAPGVSVKAFLDFARYLKEEQGYANLPEVQEGYASSVSVREIEKKPVLATPPVSPGEMKDDCLARFEKFSSFLTRLEKAGQKGLKFFKEGDLDKFLEPLELSLKSTRRTRDLQGRLELEVTAQNSEGLEAVFRFKSLGADRFLPSTAFSLSLQASYIEVAYVNHESATLRLRWSADSPMETVQMIPSRHYRQFESAIRNFYDKK